MTLSIQPIPVAGTAYMRAICDDLTVVRRLGFLAKEEIFMCFWDSVQIFGRTEVGAILQKLYLA